MKLLLVVISTLNFCNSYNLFPKHAQIFSSNTEGSYFGFSVQLTSPNRQQLGYVIVGAPRANSTLSDSHLNINEPGSIFRCSIESNSCDPYLLDVEGNHEVKEQNKKTYRAVRDHSWLGASLDVSSYDVGPFLACAPRWLHGEKKRHALYGSCYYLNNTENVGANAKKIIPLLNQIDIHLYTFVHMYGEAGMSIQLTQDQRTFILGAPGVYNFTGSIITVDTSKDGAVNIIDSSGTNNLKPYSYFGYKVSSGVFDSSGKIYYVSGAPRGNNLTGEVFLYTVVRKKLNILYHFKGLQLGEYFGSELAVADVNNDGFDDIIIGAPMHFVHHESDVGAVYVFTNTFKKDGKLSFLRHVIRGKVENARLGYSISSVGDVNKDGFADIAIGAPYHNNNSGAIYLHLGSEDGLIDEPSQRIFASDISADLRGFGCSVSHGIDIDGNKYNDIAVGSYLSGHVVVIKSRPIISVEIDVLSDVQTIPLTASETTFKIIVKYKGTDAPDQLKLTLKLFVRPYFASFLNNRESLTVTENYKLDVTTETSVNVLLKNVTDYFKKVRLDVEILLPEDEEIFCASCPIFAEDSVRGDHLEVPFSIGCGSDNICDVDLEVSAKFPLNENFLVLGAADSVSLEVKIRNKGENAPRTILSMVTEENVHLGKYPNLCEKKHSKLICDVANLLKTDEERSMTIDLDISKIGMAENLIININATSLGNEINSLNNILKFEFPFKIEAELNLVSFSRPENLTYRKEKEIYSFQHQFTIRNDGPSPLNELDIVILIPARVKENNIFIKKPEVPDFCEEPNEIEDAADRYETAKIETNSSTEFLVFKCDNPSLSCWEIKCLKKDFYKNNEIKPSFTLNLDYDLLSEFMTHNDVIEMYTTTIATSKYFPQNYFTSAQITINSEIKIAALPWMQITSFIIAGIILVIILILVLWKCKFFNRHLLNKMKEQGETAELVEKMNKNGKNEEELDIMLDEES